MRKIIKLDERKNSTVQSYCQDQSKIIEAAEVKPYYGQYERKRHP